MEETLHTLPDAIVLAETNLSFTYTLDYVEAAGWKMYTACEPSKSGSRADAITGGVSLLERAGSVKVKTNILMKNNSHRLVNWGLSNSDSGFIPFLCITGVYFAQRAKIPISRTVKAFKLLKDNFVLPTVPNSSTAFSSMYHIVTGDFNAYTGEVQPGIGTDIYFVELETPDTSRGIASQNREQRRNRSKKGTYYLASQ
jgi:hypothetical protein